MVVIFRPLRHQEKSKADFVKRSQSDSRHCNPSKNAGNLHHGPYCRCGLGDISQCALCCTRIESLSVTLGDNTVFKDVNLHIHCGELTAVIGRNGAGKTTFFRALLGEIPHEGNIFFSSTTRGSRKPRFGYVPQKLQIENGAPVSVGDLVLSCLSRRPVWFRRRKKDQKLIERVLSGTQTGALESRRLCDLSGGELQRVLLAVALWPAPDILLLDEPVSGVDRRGLSAFYQLVSELRKKNDLTILIISHDLELAARYADRTVLFTKGTVISGKPEAVFKTTEFAQDFGSFHFPVSGESL